MSKHDDFDGPRMQEYLTADDLDTDACVRLASTILADAANNYLRVKSAALADPEDKRAAAQLRLCRNFYHTDYFAALSGGVMDGDTALRGLDAQLNKEGGARRRVAVAGSGGYRPA